MRIMFGLCSPRVLELGRRILQAAVGLSRSIAFGRRDDALISEHRPGIGAGRYPTAAHGWGCIAQTGGAAAGSYGSRPGTRIGFLTAPRCAGLVCPPVQRSGTRVRDRRRGLVPGDSPVSWPARRPQVVLGQPPTLIVIECSGHR